MACITKFGLNQLPFRAGAGTNQFIKDINFLSSIKSLALDPWLIWFFQHFIKFRVLNETNWTWIGTFSTGFSIKIMFPRVVALSGPSHSTLQANLRTTNWLLCLPYLDNIKRIKSPGNWTNGWSPRNWTLGLIWTEDCLSNWIIFKTVD